MAKEELGNCLAPGLDEHEIIVFCAMLFGFLAAPLVMGRPSSALARLWQSMIMRDGSLQLYMDDPLFGVLGPANRRKGIIAMLLYTALAMGINLAFHKGERGLMVKWIGVAMELNVREASFVLSVPKKVSVEILEKMRVWKGKGMISLRGSSGPPQESCHGLRELFVVFAGRFPSCTRSSPMSRRPRQKVRRWKGLRAEAIEGRS